MGKGSAQRPTDKAAFDSGYERIFGRQAKSEAALQAIVDFSQERGLYEDMPIENDRIGGLFMEAYEKDLFIRMGGKLRADQQSMGTNDEMKDGLYDLFEDVAAKLKYEPLTRSEQHQQLERIVSPEFTGKITTPNQTCGNCKHWPRHHDHHPARCANIDLVDMIDTDGGYWGFESPADFSCSLWKAKP